MYLREAAEVRKSVVYEYIKSEENPADVMTKILPRRVFEQHVATLMSRHNGRIPPRVQKDVGLNDLH